MYVCVDWRGAEVERFGAVEENGGHNSLASVLDRKQLTTNQENQFPAIYFPYLCVTRSHISRKAINASHHNERTKVSAEWHKE